MPGKSVEKLFRKLHSRKHRRESGLFIAEGPKVVGDLLRAGVEPKVLLSSDHEWSNEYGAQLIEEKMLKELSRLETANEVLAVFHFPRFANRPGEDEGRVVVLDRINDPGNLGTIIRTCDWFGIRKVLCVKGTTDVYNSKCIQSTMGSIARVEVIYASETEIEKALPGYEWLVADLEGADIYKISEKMKNAKTALILGSESHGPSRFWKERALPVTIPRISDSGIESLNVAQAAAIIISHIMRPLPS